MAAHIVSLSANSLRIALYAKQHIPSPFEEENVMTHTEYNDKKECIIFISLRKCHIHKATC